MSGGRIELGLGAGWYEAEHRAHAIPFPPLGDRFEMLEEQLAVITGLWATADGETFSFTGNHYEVSDSPGLPKPLQRPRPPIVIGGSGTRRTPRLAAAYADEFNSAFKPLEQFTEMRERVRQACEAHDRDPATMIFSVAQVLCCGRDGAEVERRAAAIGKDPADLSDGGIVGTADECAAKLREFSEAGASRVYLQVLDDTDLDHLDLVMAEVSPAL
jgi:alkanesulfonate monooxygenase SsuD/methylene tetrahydromethanopterin reductase-like flavin-dependent oxidoreductase (luciferase family)